MDKKEKIRKIYQKLGVQINKENIDKILENEEKTKQFMRLYKQEEIESMNYILGKPDNNNYFTEFELRLMSGINLFNRKTVEFCKKIYEKERRCPKCI